MQHLLDFDWFWCRPVDVCSGPTIVRIPVPYFTKVPWTISFVNKTFREQWVSWTISFVNKHFLLQFWSPTVVHASIMVGSCTTPIGKRSHPNVWFQCYCGMQPEGINSKWIWIKLCCWIWYTACKSVAAIISISTSFHSRFASTESRMTMIYCTFIDLVGRGTALCSCAPRPRWGELRRRSNHAWPGGWSFCGVDILE